MFQTELVVVELDRECRVCLVCGEGSTVGAYYRRWAGRQGGLARAVATILERTAPAVMGLERLLSTSTLYYFCG